MKLSFWDIMASMVMLAGLALATIFINIFVNPYSFINPFPPPTPIATLDVPTLTPSQRSLPELWTLTPTLYGASDSMGTPTITATGPTTTATVTGTVQGIILPTRTVTRTPTITPTITKTFSKTPNRTLTSYYVKTATKTPTKTTEGSTGDTTPPTTPGTPYSNSLASDPNPVFSWGASTDTGGSGFKEYKVTWGTDSGGNNPMYATTATSWTAPTLTTNGIYYFFVRAVDNDGNQSAWAGPSRFGFTGAGGPTVITSAATGVNSSSAVLNGLINANGDDTLSYFEYGTSTTYGTVVTASPFPVTGTTSTSITSTASPLIANTTYHFRAFGINAHGRVNGGDGTFTTSKLASTTTIGTIAPEPSTFGAAYSVPVTVSGTSGTPTGTVSVSDGSANCTVTLAAGTGSCNITPASAGAKTITATYNGNTTYAVSSGTASHTVNKANPTVSGWPTASSITFGQTLASSILTGGTPSVAGTFAFTNSATVPPSVGPYTADVTFTPTNTTNYNTVPGTVIVTVGKATPTISPWPSASAITFGQTLADSSLTGGIPSVAGAFSFDNPTEAPDAGTFAADVTFTPTDTANYNTVSGSVNVTVNKADPDITTWPTSASGITYGQTLASSSLSGGVSVTPGSFTWTTPGTTPPGGTNSYGVTFTPTDGTNYKTATNTVSVTVAPANQTITFTAPGAGTVGGTYTPAGTASSGLTVSFTIDAGSSAVCHIDGGGLVTYDTAGSCVINANQAGNSNYNAAPQVQRTVAVS